MTRAHAWLPAGFALVAIAVLGLVLRDPLAVSVFGLASFGMLHIALELRYVIGRFADRLAGSLGWLLVLLLTVLVGARLLATINRTLAQQIEAAGAFVLVGLAVWIALRGRARTVGLVIAVFLALLALAWPAWYWHLITHLHNVVPLIFLWDWSRRLAPRTRNWFLAAQVGWGLIVPALIVLGAFDALLSPDAASFAAGWVADGQSVINAAAPPGASAELAYRFMVAFAFGQSMHYVVWIGFLPAFAPEATAAFGRLVPALRGWRLPVLAIVAALALGAAFWSDYALGRFLYGLVAAYHVYLEVPVLIFLLIGWRELVSVRQPQR